jgi:DNA-binding transcriptional regulator YdaS (Cro superfamily)
MHILERAIELGGPTQEAFAKAIGKKQSYVSMLKHRVVEKGRPVPADICPAIERATLGAVTCRDLRPDVFQSDARKPKRRAA